MSRYSWPFAPVSGPVFSACGHRMPAGDAIGKSDGYIGNSPCANTLPSRRSSRCRGMISTSSKCPWGGGAALDVGRDLLHGQVRMPEILWAERREGELQVFLQARLSGEAVAELERAAGMRIRTWLTEELHGTLLGLLDEAGETLGIGILRHIHFTGHRIEVLTAEGIEGILGIQWSHTRMEPSGDLHHALSTAR